MLTFLLFVFRAVDLAEKHDFPQIEALIARHTSQLLQKGDPLQAVEVYRMAGKATDAALLLAKLAEDAGKMLNGGPRCCFSPLLLYPVSTEPHVFGGKTLGISVI